VRGDRCYAARPVRRLTLQSLLGPALLLYLVADAASSQGQIDPLGVIGTLVAAALMLAPRLLVHDATAQGARAVGLLGLCLGVALVRVIAPRSITLAGDIAHALSLSGSAALVALLASYDGKLGPRRRRTLALAIGAVGAVAGLLAVLPPPRIAGLTLIVPASWSHVPLVLFACTVLASTFLRLARRGTGTPSSQAAQSWVLLGLLPANAALAALAYAAVEASSPRTAEAARGASMLAAWLLAWGHGASLDPDRRLLAGSVARRAAAFLLVLLGTLIALRSLQMFLAPFHVELPLELLIAIALCLAAILRGPAEHGAMSLLAPAQGRLLRAIERTHEQLMYASSLETVAQVVLSALRGAASESSFGAALDEPSNKPTDRALLYRITPPCEVELDAAGVAHVAPRGLHPEIERALRERPGDTLVRATLEAKIVREPPLRPLIAALVDLDALCVVPLIHDAELEGALVVPRSGRRRALTLEELAALDGLARHVAGFLSVLGSDARAQERAERAFIDARLAETASDDAARETDRLRHELRALHGLPRQDMLEAKPIAYSASMRALLAALTEHAGSDAPLWLTAERGVEVASVARFVHDGSARKAGPLVAIACASLSADDAAGFLERVLHAGEGGTILLSDLAALPLETQRSIAQLARAAGLARAASSAAGKPRARVIVAARHAPEVLAQSGALAPELCEAFPVVLGVPSLRARREDLASLVLLALDQAARVLGKSPVGIDAEAQARLLAHDFTLNSMELQAVIERAVTACEGPRIEAAGIALALGMSERAAREELALDGTFERIERRVLKRALERTSGNKSEAARMLGLPRTTFIDKLRRHNLDDRGDSTPPLRSAG
jgi:DNA-binding NtrC family response regulator